jgi:hypothetical protein
LRGIWGYVVIFRAAVSVFLFAGVLLSGKRPA